jgi:hypothetical protein
MARPAGGIVTPHGLNGRRAEASVPGPGQEGRLSAKI